MSKNKTRLWGGRFKKATDPYVERYTSSLAIDVKLVRYDVLGSIAHAKMLGHTGIIKKTESIQLVKGLQQILKVIDAGNWKIDPSVEDVHTQVQKELEKIVGAPALKIHTARSRNDQVCLDLRLYCRDAIDGLQAAMAELQQALVSMADENQAVMIPGYTHLQRAQAVSVAHHLLAYVEMIQRDVERLEDLRKRVDIMPLGSGALAGTSLPIDRKFVAAELGFKKISTNSMDAVSDRDFAMELVCVLAQLGVHLSRLSEDAILWASDEFGVLQLDDAFATGSSLMPQKKNPDVFELVRGQAGLTIGAMTGFFTMMKGLPLSYNRDLQWDKHFIFEVVERSQDALEVLARLFAASSIRKDVTDRLLADDAVCATDLAEYLVEKGVAFRDAHGIVGAVVAYSESKDKRLQDLTLKELKGFAPQCEASALKVLNPVDSVKRKQSLGSTGPREVKKALQAWKKKLGKSS